MIDFWAGFGTGGITGIIGTILILMWGVGWSQRRIRARQEAELRRLDQLEEEELSGNVSGGGTAGDRFEMNPPSYDDPRPRNRGTGKPRG